MIYQLSRHCWAMDPQPSGEDYLRHWDTRKEVTAAIREAKRDDDCFNPDTKPRELESGCWLIQCDGECEEHVDELDEGYISHCESRQVAEEMMAAYRWSYRGDLVFCEEDAPEGSEIPPPSPAELEAAGQMRLPGVA